MMHAEEERGERRSESLMELRGVLED